MKVASVKERNSEQRLFTSRKTFCPPDIEFGSALLPYWQFTENNITLTFLAYVVFGEMLNTLATQVWILQSVNSSDDWIEIRSNIIFNKPWDWDWLSLCGNITLSDVVGNPDKPWMYDRLCKNPCIFTATAQDILNM